MIGLPPRAPGRARARIAHRVPMAPMIDLGSDRRDPPESDGGTILADICFGDDHQRDPSDPRRIVIGTPPLGDWDRELWRVPGDATTSGWHGDIGYVRGDGFMFAHLLVREPPDTDLVRITHSAYRDLLAFVVAGPCPQLLRIWNYLDRINDWEHGLERYQAFCKGRSQAFADAGIPARRFPAATAIGSRGPGLSVHLLSGQVPGTPVESPRQVSAYRYPRPYGPRPPSFARALHFTGPGGSRELAVSGTSSIIGYVTMHPHHLERQLRETVRNLDSLTASKALPPRLADAPPLLLKVYLRDPAHIAEVAPLLRAWTGDRARIMYLRGDICRAELEIEIEAHRSSPGTDTNPQPDTGHAAHP